MVVRNVKKNICLSTLLLVSAFLTLFVLPLKVRAEFFVPQSLGGQISYGYGISRAQNAETERTSLNLNFLGTGYFWEPWMVTMSGGIGLGLSETNSNPGGGSEASTITGNVDFTVFPRSRFPTFIGYSVTNSRTQPLEGVFTAGQDYEARRFYIRQLYNRSANLRFSAYYNNNQHNSEGLDDSEDQTFGFIVNQRQSYQVIQGGFRYNTTKFYNPKRESSDSNIFLNHGYYPSTDLGVISLANYVETSSKTAGISADESTSVQGSSSFYWRPEHRPYFVSGGIRLFKSENAGQENRSAATTITGSYRFSRNTRVNLGASVNLSETGDQQTTTVSESLTGTYNSDPYRFIGMDYSWAAGAGFSNSNRSGDTGSQTSTTTGSDSEAYANEDSVQTANASLSHRVSKGWVLGNYSSMRFNFGQGVGGGKSSVDEDPVYSVNHSTGVSWSRSAPGAQTSANLQYSDNRSYAGDTGTIFKMLNFQLTRQQNINRLSGLTGTFNFQASQSLSDDGQQTTDTGEEDINHAGSMSLAYYHSRFFGIYRLRFDSILTTRDFLNSETNTTVDGESNDVKLDWRNNFTYNIGLLSTALNITVTDVGGESRAWSAFFRATRSF